MDMKTLPEVAKSFTQHCTKCDAEKYHRVLSHVDEFKAKVQCEICGKKSTFSIKPKKVSKGPRVPKKTKAQIAGGEWRAQMDKRATDKSRAYSIKEKFNSNEKFDHPKFGVGFVLAVSGNRITVLFEEGEKTLIHAS